LAEELYGALDAGLILDVNSTFRSRWIGGSVDRWIGGSVESLAKRFPERLFTARWERHAFELRSHMGTITHHTSHITHRTWHRVRLEQVVTLIVVASYRKYST